MKVILLGTGSPRPDPARMSASLLISGEGRSFLVDCGRNVSVQLTRAGVPPHEVGPLFLTHHHFDHLCGLDDFAITSWILGRREALPIYGPPGTRAITDALFQQVYRTDLQSRQLINPGRPPFRVEVTEVKRGLVLEDGPWRVQAAPVDHWATACPELDALSLAYRFELAGRAVAVSGDTTPCPELVALAQGADLLVHECFGTEADFVRMKVAGTKHWAIHTSSLQVGEVAAQAGVPRLVLTHFPHHCTAKNLAQMETEVRRSYGGELIMGHDLLEVEV